MTYSGSEDFFNELLPEFLKNLYLWREIYQHMKYEFESNLKNQKTYYYGKYFKTKRRC